MKIPKIVLVTLIVFTALITLAVIQTTKTVSSYSQAMNVLSTLGTVYTAEGELMYTSLDEVLSPEELHSLALLSNEYTLIRVTNQVANNTEMELYDCRKDLSTVTSFNSN